MQLLPLIDPGRPPRVAYPFGAPSWQAWGTTTPGSRPDLSGMDWQRPNAAWGIKANFPAVFTGKKYSDDPTTLLFETDFALAADLESFTDELIDDSTWVGTKLPSGWASGPMPPSTSVHVAEVELARAIIEDRVNARMQEAHARNRWDLLDQWYPLVAERLGRYINPYFKEYLSSTAPMVLHEPSGFKYWPTLTKHRDKLEQVYTSGKAAQWWTQIATNRIKDGLPSPNWLGPYVPYTPYWWVIRPGTPMNPPKTWSTKFVDLDYGKWLAKPKKIALQYTLSEIDTSDKVIKILSAVSLSIMGGAMLSAATAGIWASIGAPAVPVITDALAAGIKAELGGGDFTGAAISGIIGGAGDLVSDLGGGDLLSTAADLAAGNIDSGEAVSNLFSGLTDGLGWVDDALGDANDFMDSLIGIGDAVSSFGDTFSGSSGGFYPTSPPPIFNEGEAAGLGTPGFPPATEFELADSVKPPGSGLAIAALGALLIFAA